MNKRVFLLGVIFLVPVLLLTWWTSSQAQTSARVQITAVLYDGLLSGDADEAVALRNVTDTPVDLSGWSLTDEEAAAVFPAGVVLDAGEQLWIARRAADFRRSFGFGPDFEVTETETAVPNLSGGWTGLGNSGDQVLLRDDADVLVDCVPFEGNYGGECGAGWSGVLVQPYLVTGVFGAEGQILVRKRDQATGYPVADTNSAADWAQDPDDVIDGRKVQYPGWDMDTYFTPAQLTETAVLTIAIAPDNAYQAIVDQINSAQTSIQIESLTFENVAIANALTAARGRGVDVTVLLEGAPSGGIDDQQKYVCAQLEASGAACWFMISDDAADIYDRYRFLHAKFMLIDGDRVIISSENLSPNSLPSDDKADGTWGRRGVVLITDAPGVVAHVQGLFAADFDVANHLDLFRWQASHDKYGAPPPGFAPILDTGGVTYTIRFPQPVAVQGTFGFELVQSPENSLRTQDGLLGLVSEVGEGDTLLVQQLAERPFWGASSSNAQDDPNPRLEAYIDAARRGAKVRLLLDAYFDTPGSAVSNTATCQALAQTALTEQLDLACRTANPTGLGIHNKMVLAQIDGRGYVHVGSLNGTEQSSKGNRELALQVQSDAAYALLAEMFTQDWPWQVSLPVVLHEYVGPAGYVLISELLYDPLGPDDAEFVELVNPTGTAVDLSGFSISDAVSPTDFEDLRRFPPGTVLAPGETVVIATAATAFKAQHGVNPDFEVLGTDTAVPDLIDDLAWGDPAATLQFGNSGDEVILRSATLQVVDAIAYGSGSFPGVVGCAPVTISNHSLERYPYWRDTNDCTADFRDWPYPNPGALP